MSNGRIDAMNNTHPHNLTAHERAELITALQARLNAVLAFADEMCGRCSSNPCNYCQILALAKGAHNGG